MPASQRLVDELVEAFDLNQRRKFVLKHPSGKSWDLYFPPITRADRKKAQALAGSEDALDISTQMLCQKAETADGTKPFAAADREKLQRLLPESVLNELELFLFGLGEDADYDEAKND
jgi:hypothetical protein